jgi:hypothetical protein
MGSGAEEEGFILQAGGYRAGGLAFFFGGKEGSESQIRGGSDKNKLAQCDEMGIRQPPPQPHSFQKKHGQGRDAIRVEQVPALTS